MSGRGPCRHKDWQCKVPAGSAQLPLQRLNRAGNGGGSGGTGGAASAYDWGRHVECRVAGQLLLLHEPPAGSCSGCMLVRPFPFPEFIGRSQLVA